MPAKKENRMRKEFEEKDIHQEVRLNKYLSEAGVCSRPTFPSMPLPPLRR